MLYQTFYPKWNEYYTTMLRDNCTAQISLYQAFPRSNSACVDTALCMMENASKNAESQTASTGVLLGLLPSILSVLGSSPVELGLLSTSRPVLSLFLSLGAPVINPIRLMEYGNPKDILENLKQDGHHITTRRRKTSVLIMVLQYSLAIAAMVNVSMMASDLYTKAFSVVTACSGRHQIFVWNYVAAALLLGGLLSLMSRSRIEVIHDELALDEKMIAPQISTPWSVRLRGWIRRWPRNELSLCEEHAEQRFYWDPENQYSIWLSQALALGTVAHMLFGTAILSGYQFIAPVDAFGIVGRYVASAWVSRLILKYELAGLAARTEVQ